MNSVVHFEIPAKDMARSKKFYEEVFGWKSMDMGDDYKIVTTTEIGADQKPLKPGAINGGMMKEDGSNLNSVIVIDVPSIDEHLQKIKSAGGKILMEKGPVGDMGYYARFQDTEGVTVGLWENKK